MKCDTVSGLEEWSIFEDEVSAGVFELKAVRATGESVTMTGIDPDELFRSVVEQAEGIERARTSG